MDNSISKAEELFLEQIYIDSLIWEKGNYLEKGRPVAPIGTIKKIGETEYIKTNDGWRYHKKQQSTKQDNTQPQNKNSKVETQHNTSSESNTTIQEGHELTAPDGTKGKVVSNDGNTTTIEYVKDGQKKEAQVSSQQLEQNKQSGSIQHNSKPSTLKDHHKQFIEDSHLDGKSATHILSRLKEQGVDEDEALNAISEHRKTQKQNKEGEGKVESKESHEKRGFDESKGDEDITRKEEKIKKEDKSEEDIHEDHDNSIQHQAIKETNHKSYLDHLKTLNVDTKKGLEEASKVIAENSSDGFSTEKEVQSKPTPKVEMDEKTKKISEKFGMYERSIRSVIDGNSYFMAAYGAGGVGKTFNVVNELKKQNKKPFIPEVHDAGDDDYDYVMINSKVTAAGLYQLMNDHPNKLMVFDDCNSLFTDPTCIDMLKNATDTRKERPINWNTAKPPRHEKTGEALPKQVNFTGSIIITTNLPLKEIAQKNKDIGAVLTRGPSKDLTMTNEETVSWINHIAKDPKTGQYTNLKFPGNEDYTHQEMSEVLDYMNSISKKVKDPLSIRSVNTLLGFQKQAKKDKVDWKVDANEYFGTSVSKSESVTFQEKKNRLDSIYGKQSNPDFLKARVEGFNKNFLSRMIKSNYIYESFKEDTMKSENNENLDLLLKSTFISKNFKNGKYTYKYPSTSIRKLEDSNFSEQVDKEQRIQTEKEYKVRNKIEQLYFEYKDCDERVTQNNYIIESILKQDGKESVVTRAKREENKKLEKEKQSKEEQIEALHKEHLKVV